MKFWKYLMMLVVVCAIGCGGGSDVEVQNVTPPPEKTPVDAVRTTLETIAESGNGGSEVGAMMGSLEEMKATDPAKAEELLADANELMGMSSPAKIKAKAKEMIEKL